MGNFYRLLRFITLLSFLFLAIVACDEDATSPAGKSTGSEEEEFPDSTYQFVDYPRTGMWLFDVLPVSRKYVPGSMYTGVSAPTPGPCHVVPLHSYRWSKDTIGGLDTLRIDTWVTTRCKPPVGTFPMMRLFLDMRSDRFKQPITVKYQWTHANGKAKSGSFIWDKVRTEPIEAPSILCPTPAPSHSLASSPYIYIEPLQSCRDIGKPDSLQLTLWLEPPVLRSGIRCLPTPTLMVVELVDPSTRVEMRSAFYMGTCF